MTTPACPVIEWHGCYDDQWSKLIVPEAFEHPAKFAPGLVRRIYGYGIARGWWKKGDTVGDCFGGVACGGIMAGYAGLNWVGVELEPKFVAAGTSNIARHVKKFEAMGLAVSIRIIQGDSRQFSKLIAQRPRAVVTSPPFLDARSDTTKAQPTQHGGPCADRHYTSQATTRYGSTDGQIGHLRAGDLDGVVSSPPFTQTPGGAKGINVEGYNGARGADPNIGKRTYQGLGGARSAWNIEILKEGTIDGAVTSPPWESNTEGGFKGSKFKSLEHGMKAGRGHGASDEARRRQMERDENKSYGESAGQIGKEKSETYWQAVCTVYRECFAAMKPGGFFCCVVKDYVKNKQRVPLCDQTLTLLASIGFEPVERIHAMLVQETEHADLFNGVTVQRRERKSFFRRMAEKKGSPRIDWEEVLVVRKPL